MAAGISGAGAEITALAESLQAYACAARQQLGKELKSIDEVNPKTIGDADCDRTLKQCLDGLDETWKDSVIVTANQMFRDFRFGAHKFYRGGSVPAQVYKEFSKFKKEAGFSGDDKWNPADIWAIRTTHQVKKDFKSIIDLNEYIADAFKKEHLMGISLKKIGKGQTAHSKIYNVGNQVFAEFKAFKLGKDMTSSKDAYITFKSENGEGELQLRNFSSRPLPSSWQGELKGKFAAAGKIGGGPLIQAALRCGVPQTKMLIPNQVMQYVNNPKSYVTKFCTMFKELSGTTESINSLEQIALAKAAQDKTWWMSKIISVAYCHAVKTAKKEKEVTNAVYAYASSASDLSSVFVKYS